MEYITQILNSVISQFDFTYCLTVNILTYIIINIVPKNVTTWQKRLILLVSILLVGIVYYIDVCTFKILVNSAILAPVAWSWVFKPICKKLGIDYQNINFYQI